MHSPGSYLKELNQSHFRNLKCLINFELILVFRLGDDVTGLKFNIFVKRGRWCWSNGNYAQVAHV